MTNSQLIDGIAALIEISHQSSKDAGWWTDRLTNLNLAELVFAPAPESQLLADAIIGRSFALIHSEVSEALEGYRKNLMDSHIPTRLAIEVELADALLRIGDLAGALKLDLAGAAIDKLKYNASRRDHSVDARSAVNGKRF